ncbi:MAG: hypothetical protein ACTSYL_08395 [Candidatus Thorarchaeota archaeon]
MSEMTDYEGATAGRVLDFASGETIVFPSSFRTALGTERALMVLVYKDRQVRIFPLESESVYYLSIVIGKLTNDFLTELSRTFKEYGLVDLLYSTGVCLRGTRCFYECYFSPHQLTAEVKDLENSLTSLEGVVQVVIEPVNT